MEIKELYQQWIKNADADPDLIAELKAIDGNEDEISDRFYTELEFGTAGLRGVIGAGTNRMNYYTVCRATQGLADFLNAHYDHPSCAIGYDSRIKSDYFSKEAAKTLAANGIKCYTTDRGKEYPDDIMLVNSLHELCKASDILFLSLPKTPSTDNLFGKELFGLLKGKYIVNVGRSNCIDEAALFEALANGGMGGAAIDTWREKPTSADELLLPFDVPFQTLDNVLLSSHKAMQVADGHARYVEDTLNNVLRYLNGALPDNIVDCRKGY